MSDFASYTHGTAYKRIRDSNAVDGTQAIILAGGSGSRLKSLTRWHSKPAVPFGGKYKSIDFPLSNCINSKIRKISILTQYKSHSLNMHINQGWNFLKPELGEFIDLVPAQQRVREDWYQGTADAVYQCMDIIREHSPKLVLILAGDHIYKMDYGRMIHEHLDSGAEMTIGCIEVDLKEAKQFGVLSADYKNNVIEFTEKPANPNPCAHNPGKALASMGIYVFHSDFLYDQLAKDASSQTSSHDFGKDIIPGLIGNTHVNAYCFRDDETGEPGYWRDVGTIDAYYEANMALCDVTPPLNLYDKTWPIMSYQEQLPPAKFVFNDPGRRGSANDSLISSGCIISGSTVDRCLVFNNVRVNSFGELKDSVILPNVVIGRNCKIQKAIIDRDCNIPSGTTIGFDINEDRKRFYVSENGIVLVSAEMLDGKPGNAADL
ncbi:MAG: glucose-1-phosphate adenylyltransferase [Gammaproteobacteria bacterium]|nr:MAG: glucose-1-phosphate adenylyltransferase [Pseudomonadota bacterium]PIE38422.1 MAG: glucose-1-phosphate adenylyltransferase [Gammaproteobacteria bacterium]